MKHRTGESFPRGDHRPQRWRAVFAALFVCCLFWPNAARADSESGILPGVYKLEKIMASTTRIPFFGSSKSASKSISLVEIRRDGDGLIQSHRVCDFRVLQDSRMIKMIFPEKFIAALARPTYPIRLEKGPQGWHYRADLGLERIGYRPNGADDSLPTKIDDPVVYDWDGDGRPGATLKLSIPLLPAGELYIVQRGQSILTGRVVRPGVVEGHIQVRRFEQKVLAARPGFLAKSPEIEPDPQGSRFTLSRLSDGATCDGLRVADGNP